MNDFTRAMIRAMQAARQAGESLSVYAVSSGNYSDYAVAAIYPTRTMAEEACKEFNAKKGRFVSEYFVEEFPLGWMPSLEGRFMSRAYVRVHMATGQPTHGWAPRMTIPLSDPDVVGTRVRAFYWKAGGGACVEVKAIRYGWSSNKLQNYVLRLAREFSAQLTALNLVPRKRGHDAILKGECWDTAAWSEKAAEQGWGLESVPNNSPVRKE